MGQAWIIHKDIAIDCRMFGVSGRGRNGRGQGGGERDEKRWKR